MSLATRIIADQIAEAWCRYRDAVRAVCEKHDEADLLVAAVEIRAMGGESTVPGIDVTYNEWADWIEAEVGIRRADKRAEPILAAGGAYCVAHDCDTRECHGKGLHE